MPAVPIRVVNAEARDAVGIPLRCGVPLARGLCRDADALCVRDAAGPLTGQLTPLARWPDGSLRWVLVECLVTVAAASETRLLLGPRARDGERASAIDGHRAILARVRPDSPIPHLSRDGRELDPFGAMRLVLEGVDGETWRYESGGELNEERGAVRSTFRTDGRFVNPEGASLRVDVRLELRGAPSLATLRLTLHNPRAARHAGGFWDLGDPGSSRFGDLSVLVDCRDRATLEWRTGADMSWSDAGARRFLLTQLTSGASLRASPNHVNAAGRVPSPEEGFRVRIDGETRERGARASPALRLASDGSRWTLRVERFWESFPKALERDGERLRIGLFPREYPDPFELQGGEKKTHVFHVALDGDDLDWVDADVVCLLERDAWAATGALPYLAPAAIDRAMDALIERGLSGPDNFFAKRERIDEYGWRHFGDVHADHETWNLGTDEPFSSHYNNQYDLLYGFIRAFAHEGRPQWFRLARDLARHVMDIDVYDTDEDRPEYNGGLFWHTEHYRPAGTCTHRTYAAANAEDDEASGGGPGGEHCYTTGLKLYHLMTGCERARRTVLDLARWIGDYYDGGGTLLEETRRLLTSRTRTALATLRGAQVPRHRYPIHRGIGNLVVAQLDAFELTGSRDYLARAERVVLGTIGPEDDPLARGLDKVEEGWYYSIFLQALIRYLDVKRTLEEFDSGFFYARDSLLRYADWILAHEKPYLDDPDALEFPNHTWAAQDIRRCAILVDAYRYAPRERRDLLERARFFARYVVAALREEPTRGYTRILAILMQNHGASALALAEPARHRLPEAMPYEARLHLPHTLGSVAADGATALLGAARRTSLRAEWRWLQARLQR